MVFVLCDLRSSLKGKLAISGQQQVLHLGFELDKLQSLIDLTNAYLSQFEGLVNDLVRAKRELRNLFVFLNNQVLKIHNKKQDLKEEQST